MPSDPFSLLAQAERIAGERAAAETDAAFTALRPAWALAVRAYATYQDEPQGRGREEVRQIFMEVTREYLDTVRELAACLRLSSGSDTDA